MSFDLTDFKVGNRVEIHPACDLWMRGARFGTVKKIGRKHLTIEMDYGRTHLFDPQDIYEITS